MADRWFCTDDDGDELWRLNPDNPSDTTGDFGLVGDLPSGLASPSGLAYGDGRWLCTDDDGDELWRLNPDNPGDETGDFGLVGDLPSGLNQPGGLAYGDGRWLCVDRAGNELWRLNPDNPGDETGDFGLVGDLPSGLDSPSGLAYGDGRWLCTERASDDELWRLNPDDPSDTSGDFGLVGDLPSGLASPSGLAYGDGRWLCTDDDGDELWRLNPDNPSDMTGDFGEVGSLPSGLTTPLSIGYEPGVAPSWTDDTGDAISGTVGVAIADVTVPAVDAGMPAPTYAQVGSVAGVSFDTSTRVLSFDEDAIEAGSGTITIRATNSEGMADWTVAYNFALPDAVAPTVVINSIQAGDEGTTVQLGATLSGGTYDSVAYSWSVTGGTLDDSTSATPTLTRPDVDSDTNFSAALTVTASGTGTNAADGTTASGTATRGYSVEDVPPVITTDTDSIWQLASSQPTRPTGGTNTEDHTPSGWTRTEPSPSETQGVWRCTRTRTFSDGDFTGASIWSAVSETAPRLLTLADIAVPDGRMLVGTGSLITVPSDGDVYDSDATVVDGSDPPSLGDSSLNATRIYVTGNPQLRISEDGTGDIEAIFSAGGSQEDYQVHVQTSLTDVLTYDSDDIDAGRSTEARILIGTNNDPQDLLAPVSALASGDRVPVLPHRARDGPDSSVVDVGNGGLAHGVVQSPSHRCSGGARALRCRRGRRPHCHVCTERRGPAGNAILVDGCRSWKSDGRVQPECPCPPAHPRRHHRPGWPGARRHGIAHRGRGERTLRAFIVVDCRHRPAVPRKRRSQPYPDVDGGRRNAVADQRKRCGRYRRALHGRRRSRWLSSPHPDHANRCRHARTRCHPRWIND